MLFDSIVDYVDEFNYNAVRSKFLPFCVFEITIEISSKPNNSGISESLQFYFT
jgi:hypothetical protein